MGISLLILPSFLVNNKRIQKLLSQSSRVSNIKADLLSDIIHVKVPSHLTYTYYGLLLSDVL